MITRLRPSAAIAHGGRSPLPIDLSASLNPLGPSPAAVEAARTADLARYPDPVAQPLQEAAALRHALPTEAVVPVPGAAWALWFCLIAHVQPGWRCVAMGPCFGEYRRCVEIAGGNYEESEAGIVPALARDPDICILGNPANPAASRIPADGLRDVCARHPRTLFIVDEAFAGFAPEGTSLIEGMLPPANAVVVRSLTKELGLPGLRMGYLVADTDRAAHLRDMLPAWPLSAPALAAAVAGCRDLTHLRAGAEVARRHVQAMHEALVGAGAEVRPSSANYLLCRRPGLVESLRARGIAVRDCASFGLPGWSRIAAPAPGDLALVLEAIGG